MRLSSIHHPQLTAARVNADDVAISQVVQRVGDVESPLCAGDPRASTRKQIRAKPEGRIGLAGPEQCIGADLEGFVETRTMNGSSSNCRVIFA